MPYSDPAKRRARYHARKAEDPDYLPRIAAQHREWRAAHPAMAREAARLGSAKYRERHGDRIAERKATPQYKAAAAAWMARKRAADPDHARDLRLRQYRADPLASLKSRTRAHGISVADYQRMLADQGGTCAVCRKPEVARGSTGRVRRLAVDHDHETGAVRGLLCHSCNVAIGHLNDDPELLEGAAAYLRAANRMRLRVVDRTGD